MIMSDSQKIFTVFKASCDGGRLGTVWKYQVCSTKEKAEEFLANWTKPIKFFDGYVNYEKDKVDNVEGLACWRSSSFVYISESQLV
jgi:hypothetical protein